MLRQNCVQPQFVRASVAHVHLYSITTNQAAIIALFHVMNRNLPPRSRRNNFSQRLKQFEQFRGSIVLF
jgi:penicillin V acylase-like amidase (Ntn superfamily)